MTDPASPTIVRLHARVRGRVQGVGFRATTVEVARRIGVSGWVRNLADGDVELEAEGTRADLERLLSFLARGPRGARVDAVLPNWAPQRADQAPLPSPFGMR